jgi:hypothetical protein
MTNDNPEPEVLQFAAGEMLKQDRVINATPDDPRFPLRGSSNFRQVIRGKGARLASGCFQQQNGSLHIYSRDEFASVPSQSFRLEI